MSFDELSVHSSVWYVLENEIPISQGTRRFIGLVIPKELLRRDAPSTLYNSFRGDMNSSLADHWPSMFRVIGQTLGLKK